MKHLFKTIFPVVIAAAVVLTLSGCRSKQGGTFEKTKWGMTAVEVNNSTKRTLITNSDGSIKAEDPGTVDLIPENEGTAGTIVYYFDTSGGLSQVTVTAAPNAGSDTEKLADSVKKFLNDRFKKTGETDKSVTTWQVKSSKITLWQQSESIMICFERDD